MKKMTLPLALLALAWLVGCATMGAIPEKTGSVGACNDGYLIGGQPMRSSELIIVLEEQFASGTPDLVHMLKQTAIDMNEDYPGTVPLVIGHLSRPEGGPLRPHSSHQSGRDVDVALYAKDNRLIRGFKDMRRGDLDIAKTWHLIERMLDNGNLQYVLMDWELQKIMYEKLILFESERRLRRLFQYPRPAGHRTGVIRHAPGHANHLHVRIHCPENDWYCL
jgi:murein endopeptidase